MPVHLAVSINYCLPILRVCIGAGVIRCRDVQIYYPGVLIVTGVVDDASFAGGSKKRISCCGLFLFSRLYSVRFFRERVAFGEMQFHKQGKR